MIRIKNANKMPTEDLRAIAHFFRIVKNYLKMRRIDQKPKQQ